MNTGKRYAAVSPTIDVSETEEHKMASLQRYQVSKPILLIGLNKSNMEKPIPKLLNLYRQYAGEVELMFVDEPDEISSQLADLSNVIARLAKTLEEGENELTGVNNSLICMNDVLTAYKVYSLEIPKRLIAMHQQLEQHYHDLKIKDIPLTARPRTK